VALLVVAVAFLAGIGRQPEFDAVAERHFMRRPSRLRLVAAVLTRAHGRLRRNGKTEARQQKSQNDIDEPAGHG